MMRNNNRLFFLSNILFFLIILFTYIDLSNYSYHETVYFYEFTLKTYFLIIIFLISLLLLINNAKDKFQKFNIFVYYITLSSGMYALNFPLMDELILISSSCLFLIYLLKKKINLKKNNLIFFLILFVLLIQSIVGIFSDLRSIRYLLIFLGLIITFIYFSDLDEINENEYKIFLQYFFYAIILYVIYQFFFWYLKFFILEMKFQGQRFIGDMQPSFAKSASGHMDAILIFAGYFVILFSVKSSSPWKRLILLISILSFWIMADSRSSLLVFLIVSFFYFFSVNIYKKFFIIFLIFIIMFQKDYFDNFLNDRLIRAQQDIVGITSVQSGTKISQPTYKIGENQYFYETDTRPSYGDFGRLKFIMSGLISYAHKPIQLIGCGFYNYYYCAEEGLIYVSEKFNVNLSISKKGFLNSPIRPPAFGTIIVENGLLIIITLILYYIKFVNKNVFNKKKSQQVFISFYFFIIIISWSMFSNLLDIVLFYLFFIPIFRRLLLKI